MFHFKRFGCSRIHLRVAVTFGLPFGIWFLAAAPLSGAVAFERELLQTTNAKSHDTTNALPPFALKRLGTSNFWHAQTPRIAFCEPAAILATVDGADGLHIWDSKTGKALRGLAGKGKDAGNDHDFYLDVAYLSATQSVCAIWLRGSNSYLSFWQLSTGKKLVDLKANEAQYDGAAFAASKDGRVIVTGGSDAKLMVWDAVGHKLVKEISEGPGKKLEPFDLAVSADGTKVLSLTLSLPKAGAVKSFVTLWEVESGKALWRHEKLREKLTESYFGVALSPDGRFAIASTSITEGKAVAWDAKTGDELFRISALEKAAAGSTVRGARFIVFAPDSESFYAACGDSVIRQFRSSDGKELRAIKSDFRSAAGLTIDAGGKTLAFSEGQSVRLWDLPSGRELLPSSGHTDAINNLAFSGDASLLVSRGADQTVRLWQAGSGKELWSLPEPQPKTSSVSELRRTWYDRVAIAPNGNAVAFGRRDGVVEIADAKTGKWIQQLKGDKTEINFLSYTDKGNSLIATNTAELVSVWDIGKGELIHKYGLSKPGDYVASSFAMTADGRYLAYHKAVKDRPRPPLGVAGSSGDLGVYDLANGKTLWQVEELSTTYYQRISLSKDGNVLALVEHDPDVVGLPYRIGLWEVNSGKRIGALGSKKRANTLFPDVLAILLCDKANAAAIGLKDGHIELWDLKTGNHIVDLAGHKGPVESLALSPDGFTLASGGSEGTIVLWDLRAACAKKE